MRILVRANAHRPVLESGCTVGVEVAASPDTPGRPERWAWHIRLLDARARPSMPAAHPGGVGVTSSAAPAGGERTLVELGPQDACRVLEVQVDPALARVDVETVAAGEDVVLARPNQELMAVVASAGEVLLEDRHRLSAGDAILLTGDDPLAVRVSTARGAVVVVRLRSPSGQPLGWVP
jgi:hypothetical protein